MRNFKIKLNKLKKELDDEKVFSKDNFEQANELLKEFQEKKYVISKADQETIYLLIQFCSNNNKEKKKASLERKKKKPVGHPPGHFSNFNNNYAANLNKFIPNHQQITPIVFIEKRFYYFFFNYFVNSFYFKWKKIFRKK